MRRLIAVGLGALTLLAAAAPVLADEEPSLQNAILIQPKGGDLPQTQTARLIEPRRSHERIRLRRASRHLLRAPTRVALARTR